MEAAKRGRIMPMVTGHRINSLTYTGSIFRNSNGRVTREFKCDCGTVRCFETGRVRSGHVKSCGCLITAKGKSHPAWKGSGDLSQSYFYEVITSARRRSMECTVSIQYLWNLFLEQGGKCKFTGLKLHLARQADRTLATASLDRVDSAKGYVEGNVQWIHKKLNGMKSRLADKDFIDACIQVADHQKSLRE